MVTEEQDGQAEEAHIQEALSRCGYPEWTMKSVGYGIPKKAKKKKPKPKPVDHKTSVVIPYVEGVSEAVARVYKRYGICTAMRPYTTIRSLLVHPKDKVSKENIAGCAYRIPCKNCQKVYIGETGRSLGVRMKEYRKEVQLHEGMKCTRRLAEAPGNSHSLSRTNLRSQTMSTQKITSLTGRRRLLSAGNLIGQHG